MPGLQSRHQQITQARHVAVVSSLLPAPRVQALRRDPSSATCQRAVAGVDHFTTALPAHHCRDCLEHLGDLVGVVWQWVTVDGDHVEQISRGHEYGAHSIGVRGRISRGNDRRGTHIVREHPAQRHGERLVDGARHDARCFVRLRRPVAHGIDQRPSVGVLGPIVGPHQFRGQSHRRDVGRDQPRVCRRRRWPQHTVYLGVADDFDRVRGVGQCPHVGGSVATGRQWVRHCRSLLLFGAGLRTSDHGVLVVSRTYESARACGR